MPLGAGARAIRERKSGRTIVGRLGRRDASPMRKKYVTSGSEAGVADEAPNQNEIRGSAKSRNSCLCVCAYVRIGIYLRRAYFIPLYLILVSGSRPTQRQGRAFLLKIRQANSISRGRQTRRFFAKGQSVGGTLGARDFLPPAAVAVPTILS
jgi:hypothetical protein